MAAKSKSHGSISRKLPGGDSQRGLRKHLHLIGEVVWGWNELQRAYAFVFISLFPGHEMSAHAAWTALNNDSAQRDAIKEILHYTDALRTPHKQALRWALAQTKNLSSYRNDVVHGARGWRGQRGALVPVFAKMGNSFSRLMRYTKHETEDGKVKGVDLHRLMSLLRGDLMQLAGYVSHIGRLARTAQPSALPRRPLLRADKYLRDQAPSVNQKGSPRHPRRNNRPKASHS
jgi:hypothetical protein